MALLKRSRMTASTYTNFNYLKTLSQSELDTPGQPTVIINPIIHETSETMYEDMEGCLSIPG
jgi:peptide deformylase